jgi:hypothetical protein
MYLFSQGNRLLVVYIYMVNVSDGMADVVDDVYVNM